MELPLLGNLQSVTFKLLPANSKQQTANSKQQTANSNPKAAPPTVLVNQVIRLRGIGCRISDGVAASAV